MAAERILLVEDERAVARGLSYSLEKEGFDVLWADTGRRALEMARRENPRLILLDIGLPDISGLDVCRQLRGEGLRLPILMLTARDEELDKVLGLELGADDYIVKPYSLREVVSRVRAQLRRAYGELALPAGTGAAALRFGELELNLERMQVTVAGRAVELTPIEFKLLAYLAGHADRPRTREQIIEEVWGYEVDIGYARTVDVHIRHLRQKLEKEPARPRYLTTVRGVGYMFQS